jgi:hypothetical protein
VARGGHAAVVEGLVQAEVGLRRRYLDGGAHVELLGGGEGEVEGTGGVPGVGGRKEGVGAAAVDALGPAQQPPFDLVHLVGGPRAGGEGVDRVGHGRVEVGTELHGRRR